MSSSLLFYTTVVPAINTDASNQTLYTNAYETATGSPTQIGYISSFQFTLSSSQTVGNQILSTIQPFITFPTTGTSFSWESVMTGLNIYFLVVPIFTTLSLNTGTSVIDLQYNINGGAVGQVFANLTEGIPFSQGSSQNSPGNVPQFLVSYNPVLQTYVVLGTTTTYGLNVGSLLPFSFTAKLVQGAGQSAYQEKGYTYKRTITTNYFKKCDACGDCTAAGISYVKCLNKNYTVNLPSPTLEMPILFQNQTPTSNAGVVVFDPTLQSRALYNQFTVNKCTSIQKYTDGGQGTVRVGPMAFSLQGQIQDKCKKTPFGRTYTCQVDDCQFTINLIDAGVNNTNFFPGLTPVGNTVARNQKQQTGNVYEQLANPAKYFATLTPNTKQNPNNFQRKFLQSKTSINAVPTCGFNGTFNQASKPFCGAVSVSFPPQVFTSSLNPSYLLFYNDKPSVLIPCPYSPTTSCPIVGTLDSSTQPASYNIVTVTNNGWVSNGLNEPLMISSTSASSWYFVPTYTQPPTSLTTAGVYMVDASSWYVYYDDLLSAYALTKQQTNASTFVCALQSNKVLDFSNLQTSQNIISGSNSTMIGVGYALYDLVQQQYVTFDASSSNLIGVTSYSESVPWYFTTSQGANTNQNPASDISINAINENQTVTSSSSGSTLWTYTYTSSTQSGVIQIEQPDSLYDEPCYVWDITLPTPPSTTDTYTVTVEWVGNSTIDYTYVNLFEFVLNTTVSNLFSFYHQGIIAVWSTIRQQWEFTYVAPTYSLS